MIYISIKTNKNLSDRSIKELEKFFENLLTKDPERFNELNRKE